VSQLSKISGASVNTDDLFSEEREAMAQHDHYQRLQNATSLEDLPNGTGGTHTFTNPGLHYFRGQRLRRPHPRIFCAQFRTLKGTAQAPVFHYVLPNRLPVTLQITGISRSFLGVDYWHYAVFMQLYSRPQLFFWIPIEPLILSVGFSKPWRGYELEQ
jgi:hypothetical protein